MRRALLLCVLLIPLAAPAAAPAATTTFKGSWACTGNLGNTLMPLGFTTPLADARVELWGGPQAGTGGLLDSVFPGDEHYSKAGEAFAGPGGEWSFTVPFAGSDHRMNYFPAVYLDDGHTVSVTAYPGADPLVARGDTNQADQVVQDYRTLPITDSACTAWLALKQAYAEYVQLMGKRPPYGRLTAQYGAPTSGTPYSEFTTVMWPKGPPSFGTSTARRELAHTIRNAALGQDGFVSEVSGHPYRAGPSPCRRSNREFAFDQGWGEWYAGTFSPAPRCPGTTSDSVDVEGIVAWRLSELERGCAGVDRRRMVQTMLDKGKQIHTFSDFAKALGTCQGIPFDPNTIPDISIDPGKTRRRAVADLRGDLRGERRLVSRLADELTDARRAAKDVHCHRPPCTPQVEARMAPAILAGRLTQARLVAGLLSDQVSAGGLRRFRSDPTKRSVKNAVTAPTRLGRRLASIGARSIGQALAAAGPIARRDHSIATTDLLRIARRRRTAFAHARRHGVGLPFSSILGPAKPRRVLSQAAHLLITFDGIPDGTLITTQAPGVTFGSAGALGFPAVPPPHTCFDGPTASGGTAVAPDCEAGGGYRNSGLLAKLSSPAVNVRVMLGSTLAVPGGFAANLEGFDANGLSLTRNAELVGSSTNGQGTGPVAPVVIQSTTPIAYIALYFDGSTTSGARLVFDNLEYDVP